MQGAGEYPLSELGRANAVKSANRVSQINPGFIVASDLGRAIETANLAAGRLDLIDARLRERGAGPWEGRPRAELEAAYPGALEDDALRPDGFESLDEVCTRMRAACEDLLAMNQIVMAFTHGAVMRAFESHLTGAPARRFAQLEALVLGPNLTVLGRLTPLHEKRPTQ